MCARVGATHDEGDVAVLVTILHLLVNTRRPLPFLVPFLHFLLWTAVGGCKVCRAISRVEGGALSTFQGFLSFRDSG